MFNGAVAKCFKVNTIQEKDLLTTIEGDVVYIRNYRTVYLNIGNGKFTNYTKVYTSKSHPKYNMDKLKSLEEPYLFKIENSESLEAVPAKPGDLIYRNGDQFIYMKIDTGGIIDYNKILKIS